MEGNHLNKKDQSKPKRFLTKSKKKRAKKVADDKEKQRTPTNARNQTPILKKLSMNNSRKTDIQLDYNNTLNKEIGQIKCKYINVVISIATVKYLYVIYLYM